MSLPTYKQWFELADTTVRHYQSHKFFRDGTARAAALAAVYAQEKGCGREAVLDIFCREIESRGHVCYFDDPCDAWAA